jgi:hypothetical protein
MHYDIRSAKTRGLVPRNYAYWYRHSGMISPHNHDAKKLCLLVSTLRFKSKSLSPNSNSRSCQCVKCYPTHPCGIRPGLYLTAGRDARRGRSGIVHVLTQSSRSCIGFWFAPLVSWQDHQIKYSLGLWDCQHEANANRRATKTQGYADRRDSRISPSHRKGVGGAARKRRCYYSSEGVKTLSKIRAVTNRKKKKKEKKRSKEAARLTMHRICTITISIEQELKSQVHKTGLCITGSCHDFTY